MAGDGAVTGDGAGAGAGAEGMPEASIAAGAETEVWPRAEAGA